MSGSASNPTPTPEYPYLDGDTVVLGPEIFASQDGSVVCWKGDNYVEQTGLTMVQKIVSESLTQALAGLKAGNPEVARSFLQVLEDVPMLYDNPPETEDVPDVIQ